MEFFEVVKKRRSVRKFTSTAVPKEVIEKAIDAALVAPTSSNMQQWEFYWVKSPEKKKKLVEACMSQGAAKTAQELIVAVSRVDTWRRNRKLMLEIFEKRSDTPKVALTYYGKLIPFMYSHGPFSILGFFKRLLVAIVGLFRPMPRGPFSRSEQFNMTTKTTALACENLMLAVVAQGYACCPMEGFDECRVKRILKLGCGAQVVMVIGIGEAAPDGIYGKQIRFDKKLFVFEV